MRAPTLLATALVWSGVAFAGVPEPTGYHGEPYRGEVPATLAGAEVLDDRAARLLWEDGTAAFVDVLPQAPRPADLPEGTIWRRPAHETIPGAVWLPNTGYDALAPETLVYFEGGLARATGGDRAKALVLFCKRDCWMSWNAAKRALEVGYSRVLWYPNGSDGWAAAGLPLERVEPFAP